MIPLQVKIVVFVVWSILCTLGGFAGGWWWQGVRYEALKNDMQSGYHKALADQAEAYERDRMVTEGNRAELINTIKVKTDELEKLHADIKSGVYRVFVRGRCPTTGTAVPDTSGTPAGTCELAADTTQDLHDLEESVIKNEGLLAFCRSELFNCAKVPK